MRLCNILCFLHSAKCSHCGTGRSSRLAKFATSSELLVLTNLLYVMPSECRDVLVVTIIKLYNFIEKCSVWCFARSHTTSTIWVNSQWPWLPGAWSQLALNGQLWESGGQRSRSNKAEDLEAWRRHHSRPWFLVYSLYVWYLQFVYARIMLFCSFHMYLWCFNKITDIMTILFVFVDIFVSPCAILFFTCSVPRIIRQPFDLLQIFLRFQC